MLTCALLQSVYVCRLLGICREIYKRSLWHLQKVAGCWRGRNIVAVDWKYSFYQSVSLELIAGFCCRPLQTHGTQHRWWSKAPTAPVKTIMTFVPWVIYFCWHHCSRSTQVTFNCNEMAHTVSEYHLFINHHTHICWFGIAELWMTQSGIHRIIPFLVHKGII